MISDKAILITGGAGFVGSHYVLSLVRRKNVCVINLDALTYAGHLETLAVVDPEPEHHFVLGSIGDRSLIEYLLKRYEPYAVVNFAAETQVDRSIETPDRFIRTNVLGTHELLEATRSYWTSLAPEKRAAFRFLHISSDEVYGTLGPRGRFDEDSPHRPNSPYAASKSAADQLVRCGYQTYRLPVLTLRPSNVYGPFQFPEKLIPNAINRAIRGQEIRLFGNGENIRDWLYVEDFCRAVDRVLENGRPGEVYNAGGGWERSNLEVVTRLCEMLDDKRPDARGESHSKRIRFVEDRPGHDFRYAMDCDKIGRETGWFPEASFDTGLEKTVQWYLDNQEWCRKILEGFDCTERPVSENPEENAFS